MTSSLAIVTMPMLSAFARKLPVTIPLRAANDNAIGFPDEVLLSAALRHFAEHGLGAAEQARQRAEEAFFSGDRVNYSWWLEICRALDRRMAAAIAART